MLSLTNRLSLVTQLVEKLGVIPSGPPADNRDWGSVDAVPDFTLDWGAVGTAPTSTENWGTAP